jgi:hypothetical protein
MNTHGPPKREGACWSSAPIPKLTRLGEGNSGHSFSQPCKHKVTRVGQIPQSRDTHHPRVICAVCGCHLCWLPMSSVERRTLRNLSLRQHALIARHQEETP